jgi:hypothetical protein
MLFLGTADLVSRGKPHVLSCHVPCSRWANVGRQLPGRTDNACRRRHRTLQALERGTLREGVRLLRGPSGRFSGLERATSAPGARAGRPRRASEESCGDEGTCARPGNPSGADEGGPEISAGKTVVRREPRVSRLGGLQGNDNP